MQRKLKSLVRIKDWHIVPYWTRGLAIGAIAGAILIIIFSLFSVNSPSKETLFTPIIILLICIIAGAIIGKNYKKR